MMDEDRFDKLTRTLSSAFGRRTAVKTLAGGAVATTLAALGLTEASAKCASGQIDCGGTCVSGVCCVDQDCPQGETCSSEHQCDPGGCTSDADCPPNGLCLVDGTCFFPNTCPAGETNLDCCRNAVHKACRHRGGSQSPHGNGHQCRKRGKKRCQQNFGNT